MMLGDTWVDPRDASTWACLHGDDPWPGHTVCYHMYRHTHNEEDGATLYVGITDNIGRRLSQHRYSKPWFPQIDQIMLTCFVSRATALAYEATAIEIDDPPHNTIGRRSDA